MLHSALLQHRCRRILSLSFMSASPCRPTTPLHTPTSFPMCAFMSPREIVDSLVLTFRRVSCCSTHQLNMFLKFVGGQLPGCGLNSSMGKLFWINAGVEEEFPPIIQLHSVRAATVSRRDAKNVQEISFGFLDQFVFFLCERSDVPISNH